MLFPPHLIEEARGLLAACRARQIKICCAESCTGGLVTGLLTEIPGSSEIVDRAFVTYSNEAKMALLDIPADLLKDYGAVSEEVAKAMAEGALGHSLADISIAITGIAGPGGGSKEKPVGTVCFGLAHKGGKTFTETKYFADTGRQGIRLNAVEHAISLLLPVS